MKRIVLGCAPGGASTIVSEAQPPAIFLIEGAETVRDVALGSHPQRVEACTEALGAGSVEIAEIFGSATSRPSLERDTAPTRGDWTLDSPDGGFKYRVSTYAPNIETGLHASRTFDIDIVISGEITIIAEDGAETLLKAGDTVVIPGVLHSWRSGPEGCRVAFMMMGTG